MVVRKRPSVVGALVPRRGGILLLGRLEIESHGSWTDSVQER
jgi:hypothetical protein